MIDAKKLKEIFLDIGQIIEENKLYLSELDGAIGDGDHGINMSKGFKALNNKMSEINTDDISTILKTCGITLVSTVGGSSGPLYGTAFMKGALVTSNKTSLDVNDYINILHQALEGIKVRGKSNEGEKTLIDSLAPAIRAGKEALSCNKSDKEILNAISEAAKDGMEKTIDIMATKGRASYLGERSKGHKDPGATSMYLILDTITKSIVGEI